MRKASLLLLAVCMLLVVPQLLADSIQVQTNSTNACFAATGTCTTVATNPTAISYNGVSFNGGTGTAAQTLFTSGSGTPTSINLALGTFSLANFPAFPANWSGVFDAVVEFQLPSITGGTDLFTSTIAANVNQSNDVVTITFTTPSETLSYQTAGGRTGTFLLTVGSPISLNSHGAQSVNWTGTVSSLTMDPIGGGGGAAVPEPASLVLLGSGLLGLAGIARRRRA